MPSHRSWSRLALPMVAIAVVFYMACGGGEAEEFPPCVSVSDCPAENRCINNVCVPPGVDAGFLFDSGSDAGETGEDAGEIPMDAGDPGSDAGEFDAGEVDDAAMPIDAPMSGV